MNELAIMHYPESKYCYAIDKKTVEIRIRIKKEDQVKITLIYGGKYDFYQKQQEALMERNYEDRLFAYYECTLELQDLRLCYVFKIEEGKDVYYYSEDGLTTSYDFTLNFYNCFCYAYLNECDILKTVEWSKKAVFYQIFVDRFNQGDFNKDLTYINLKKDEAPTPVSFWGGDLLGIINKLPYLNDLGINALYLTPIFTSISNHKYDISNYFEVDKMFGDLKTFKILVKKAHELGIKIVLDAVFNHVSSNLKEFQDVIKNKTESPYYDWFMITNDDPFTYECFAACDYMPKLNTNNKEVRKYLLKVALYWIKEFGIDGWRLDVSDEVSHDFWKDFRKVCKSYNSEVILIGENWHDGNRYLLGDEYDSIMNYAFTKAALDYFAFDKFDSLAMANKLNELLMRNSSTVNNMMLNLLDSHDTFRFYTEIKKDKNKLLSALALLFMYPGMPQIYYGTEALMEGGYDPDSRRPMDFSKVDLKTSEVIKSLSNLKMKLGVLKVKIYSEDDLLLVKRGPYTLIINHSFIDKKIGDCKAYLSNGFEKGYLKRFGFVIKTEERS